MATHTCTSCNEQRYYLDPEEGLCAACLALRAQHHAKVALRWLTLSIVAQAVSVTFLLISVITR